MAGNKEALLELPLLLLLLLFNFLQRINAGAVGLCRSECLERNKNVIVRVHLKEQWVQAGLCRNVTDPVPGGALSHVFPFICDREVGEWGFDETEEEGVAKFKRSCPPVVTVPAKLLFTCPGTFSSPKIPRSSSTLRNSLRSLRYTPLSQSSAVWRTANTRPPLTAASVKQSSSTSPLSHTLFLHNYRLRNSTQ